MKYAFVHKDCHMIFHAKADLKTGILTDAKDEDFTFAWRLSDYENSPDWIVIPEKEEEMPKSALDKQVGGSHYKDLGVQPLEVMQTLLTEEEYIGFLKGNLIKYSIRQGRKEGSDDAAKAKHYQELLEEYME